MHLKDGRALSIASLRYHFELRGTTIISFDLDGRLTAHGTRTFVYDTVDNLIEVKDNGVTTATYGFDALGRRYHIAGVDHIPAK